VTVEDIAKIAINAKIAITLDQPEANLWQLWQSWQLNLTLQNFNNIQYLDSSKVGYCPIFLPVLGVLH
jgi:hypothetical protein